MSVPIISRATWGARVWPTDQVPHQVPASERRFFVVHHDGANPVLREGASIPRAIDAEHRAQGWAGIGYNFVVTQAGLIFEGRGWDLVGAHCPGRNRDGIGVQVAIGGDQVPSPAALHAVRELYDEASRRSGRALTKTWHGAHYGTECPGPRLVAWVRAGMPDPTFIPTPLEDDVPLTADEIERIAQRTAELVTGLGARNPVLVDPGTGAGKLPDGRPIDALPTVVGEIQHEQAAQRTLLERILTAVAPSSTAPTARLNL
jgi:hypothetical protein